MSVNNKPLETSSPTSEILPRRPFELTIVLFSFRLSLDPALISTEEKYLFDESVNISALILS